MRRLTATPLVPTALLVLLAACGGSESTNGSSGERPNVILITLDTVRADFLSCYGASTGETAAIDGLAKEGVVFERAMSSSGLTPASHATILTGQFQYNHGLRVLAAESGFRLDSDQVTLTTRLKDAGYRTAAVHSAFPVSAHFGFDKGFDHFDSFDASIKRRKGEDKVRWDVGKFQRQSNETTKRTLDWLSANVTEDDEDPFFLWLHYWDPHDFVKEPPKDEYDALLESASLAGIQDEQTRKYAAELRWQDGHIGDLLAAMETRGLLDDTIICVTADHGQGLADGARLHGWNNHRMLYREQVHVPLILRGPGLPSGKRIADQVRTADVTPTLLDLCGLEPLEGQIDGVSLAPRMSGDDSGHLVAYGEQINGFDHNAGMRKHRPDATFLYMVSDGDWKLIYKPHMLEASELFHVAVDEREQRNVIANHPEQVERLLTDLATRNPWVLDAFPPMASGAAADASDALSGLGYGSAGLDGTGTWWWTCPAHLDHRSDERGRHEEDGCGRILVLRGTWQDSAPEEGASDGH